MCCLVCNFKVRKSTVVVRHDHYSNVLCAKKEGLACVDSRVSFYYWWDVLPGLLFAGLTVANSVCASLEMVNYLRCLACYSIFDLWQHFGSLFSHLNVAFSYCFIYSTSFLLTVGVILWVKNIINIEKFVGISIIIETNASLICKTTWILPFLKKPCFLRLAENLVAIDLQHSHCSFLVSAHLNRPLLTCTGWMMFLSWS